MPNYDYQCGDCEHVQEVNHSMKETPKIECASCRSGNMSRIISGGSGVLFKGTGFYQTDYKNKD